jgi:hypothetical protein
MYHFFHKGMKQTKYVPRNRHGIYQMGEQSSKTVDQFCRIFQYECSEQCSVGQIFTTRSTICSGGQDKGQQKGKATCPTRVYEFISNTLSTCCGKGKCECKTSARGMYAEYGESKRETQTNEERRKQDKKGTSCLT